MDLIEYIAAQRPDPDDLGARFLRVRARLLEGAPALRSGDHRRLTRRTLRVAFDVYDRACFDGLLGRTIDEQGAGLSFRVSARMTSAGGKTTFFHAGPRAPAYEIAVSRVLLGQLFGASKRQATVVGLPCHDRLEALQRIFEHELVHLTEFVAWGRSSCRRGRFADIARRVFGHRAATHGLVTPREAAASRFGVRVGDPVEFVFEGRALRGHVNRITRRATVLVPDARGERYSDGSSYLKYYVPLEQLRRAPC